MDSSKQLAIKQVLEKTTALYKEDTPAISLASERRVTSNVDMVVSTGIPALDLVCAKAGPRSYGLPFGRQVEIFGNESMGKTTLLLQTAANVQKLGGIVYWIETEGGLDLVYAKKLGVNIEELIVSQPDYAEQVFEESETFIKAIGGLKQKVPAAILWDSAAATQTKQEMEGDFGQAHIASFGRFISQAERKIITSLSKRKILFCFTNQTRTKINTFGYGSNISTYGEGTFKFYDSIKLQLSNRAQIKEGNEVVGNNVAIKIVKNKCMPTSFYVTEPIRLIKGEGFVYGSGLLNALEMKGRIDRKKSKGWIYLNCDGMKRKYTEKFRETKLLSMIKEDDKFKSYCEKLIFVSKKKKIKK